MKKTDFNDRDMAGFFFHFFEKTQLTFQKNSVQFSKKTQFFPMKIQCIGAFLIYFCLKTQCISTFYTVFAFKLTMRPKHT